MWVFWMRSQLEVSREGREARRCSSGARYWLLVVYVFLVTGTVRTERVQEV
jgi:hypothetical protein